MGESRPVQIQSATVDGCLAHNCAGWGEVDFTNSVSQGKVRSIRSAEEIRPIENGLRLQL